MQQKTVLIASDHGGFALKSVLVQALRKVDCQAEDLGPEGTASCDYPAYADKLCLRLLEYGEDGQNGKVLGILICGTGLGMSMAANRHPGIRAAVCTNEFTARMGERVIGQGLALEIMRVFMATPFEGGRHLRRIEQFETHSQP